MRWTRTYCRTSKTGADAEVVWSWPPDAEAKRAERSARDRSKKARFLGRARRTALKPSRRECRVDPAEPVVTAASFSYCWRAMGEVFTRHSLRPLFTEGQLPRHSSGRWARENAPACPLSLFEKFEKREEVPPLACAQSLKLNVASRSCS